MINTKRIRFAAVAVTLAGGLALRPSEASAARLDECSDSDWEVAREQVNAACGALNAPKARIYSCEYHPDTGYIVWEYDCIWN